MRLSAATTSTVTHVTIVLAILALSHADRPRQQPRASSIHLTYTALAPRSTQEHGGGQREILQASLGNLPPRATARPFLAPTAHILNDHPKLPIQQAILLEPDVPVPTVALDRIGSPWGVAGPVSGGPGGPGGIGQGCCGGVGDGDGGPGIGSRQGVIHDELKLPTSLPVLTYKVEPEYSDEARKAKVQGVVTITAEIDEHGKIRKMRIQQPLGLGLDERAMEAAARWRFRPAMAGRQPVPCSVTIEVNFRLL